jgi:potassium/chloride transporter 4/5/6
VSQGEPKEHVGLGLGTFLGVVTPTMLTILGVILYLRTGWVVANAGLVGALLIVLLAHAITITTAFSLSALATSMRVGGGGAYWLISRSMGLELGGALGIPLYLSQALSLTLYSFGLAETVRIIWPDAPVQLLAALIVIGVVMIAVKSTVMALKMQLPIMVLIGVSLVALVSGTHFGGSQVEMFGGPESAGFWDVFAVFFPAVTGILAGLGLSGDLKDAERSIPRGVMISVFVGLMVYLLVPVVLANAASPQELMNNPMVWTQIAPTPLVLGGLWGAILSSAIGSILAAPRTLQALADDGLVPSYLGQVDEKKGEPMVALYVSGVLGCRPGLPAQHQGALVDFPVGVCRLLCGHVFDSPGCVHSCHRCGRHHLVGVESPGDAHHLGRSSQRAVVHDGALCDAQAQPVQE